LAVGVKVTDFHNIKVRYLKNMPPHTASLRFEIPAMDTIQFNDFLKIEIRVGTLLEVSAFPQARKPAYRLRIDFGPEIGIRQSSAQITALYEPDALVGRQVLAVVNFPPKQIATFISEVLVLGLEQADGCVVLIQAEQAVPNGLRLS
jgi:tRNA-binding protein